jgi:predicted outer membrane repeat protein
MRKKTKRFFRPTLELLENRLAPANYAVNTTADFAPGTPQWMAYTRDACSLRWAINDLNANGSNDANTINITATGTDNLASALQEIAKPVVITGPGNTGPNAFTVSGTATARVFSIASTIRVNISGLRITNGNGGIFNAGSLILTSVTITGNTAGSAGGGIFSSGPLTITNSQITANAVSLHAGFPSIIYGASGGGIFFAPSGSQPVALSMTNTAVSDNAADRDGGGIAIAPASGATG